MSTKVGEHLKCDPSDILFYTSNDDGTLGNEVSAQRMSNVGAATHPIFDFVFDRRAVRIHRVVCSHTFDRLVELIISISIGVFTPCNHVAVRRSGKPTSTWQSIM